MSRVPDAARDTDLTLRRHPAPAHRKTPKVTLTRMLEGHAERVFACAFFKDGRRVATGSRDKTLRIWDVEKGALVGEPFEGHEDWVQSVAVSPDDRRIASGGWDTTIIIWDVKSKQMVSEPLMKHTKAVFSVCFSPDGKRLASGSMDKTVVVWNAEAGTVLSTLHHHRSVWSVAFSPDGLKLASGTQDSTVQVWRTDNAQLLLKINTHQSSVRGVVWSPDSQQIVSASYDETVKFWNSSNGKHIGRPCINHNSDIRSLAISSDGSFFTTASHDKNARLWCTKTHQQIGQPLEHTASVCCVAISPNGELLMSGDGHGSVRLWSIKEILEQRKLAEGISDNEEAQRQQLLTLSDTQVIDNNTQLRSHDTNDKPVGNNDSASNCLPESHEASGSDNRHSLFDILAANTMVRDACITGDLHTAEDLLNQEIDAGDNHDSYINRSVIRARNSEWDKALQDSVKSIAIQPSLWGYISKGIALCGKAQICDAMEAFDLAFVFLDRDSMTIDLLLIKAVALFNAGRHDEALRRVQDLATAYQPSDTFPCNIVNLYLHVQLAMFAFDDGRYNEAADLLNGNITCITDLFSRGALFEPRLKIFTMLFGWDLDSLWQTVNQRRCEAFLRADCVIKAVESYQYMMGMIDENKKGNYLEWSTAFKQDCTARCVTKGDAATAASNYGTAIELYSAALTLDSSCHSLFAHRISKANLGRNQYVEALHDAEMVVEINPSSYVGYELKHAALHGVQRNDEVAKTFEIMLSPAKLDDTSDAQIRKLRQRDGSPSEVADTIGRVIHAQPENAPLLIPNPLPLSVFVDASTSFGIGFLADSRWLAWELLDGWKADGRDIGWAEMVAIDLGLRALVHSGLRDAHVRFHSDNQGVIGALKAGRSRGIPHNDILRRLSSFAVDHGIRISVEWVKSAHNLADGISRGVFPTTCSRFSSPPPLPAYLKPFVRLV